MSSDLSASPAALVSAVVTCGFWATWLALSLRRDRRRLRNGFLLVAVLYTGVGVLGALADLLPGGTAVMGFASLALFALLGLGLLVLPVLLVVNGLTMVRRERRSLANLLSLVVGVAMLVAPVVVVAPVVLQQSWAWALAAAVVLATAWLGFTFLGFVAQTLLYRRYAARVPAHGVIVLGSKVTGGRVPPLLAGRLEAAVAASARLEAEVGSPVPIVPSGGQGGDEDRPEGVAMAQWLDARGVPADRVLVEDRARTTRENLTYGVALLAEHGQSAPYLVATNNYHAPRAALEAMDLGLDVHAIGAPTAGYFFPSAYLREFVAVLRRRPTVHVVAGAGIVAVALLAGYLTHAAGF